MGMYLYTRSTCSSSNLLCLFLLALNLCLLPTVFPLSLPPPTPSKGGIFPSPPWAPFCKRTQGGCRGYRLGRCLVRFLHDLCSREHRPLAFLKEGEQSCR